MQYFDTRNDMLMHYCSTLIKPQICEIGIFKGEFLDFIVQTCNPGTIDGVDLFEGMTCSGNADGNNVIYYDIGKSFVELHDKYKNLPNVYLHKGDSSTFLKNKEDNYYDIIYLDGDHSYLGVKKDLEAAFMKVKDGGYIMGHDYEMNMKKAQNNYNFGVKTAVDEFCVTYKQQIIAKALDGCVSFCIQVKHSV